MPTERYDLALELSKRQHRSSKTYSGKFLRPFAHRIKAIIDTHECASILDYGCGKGLQYEWEWDNLTLEKYWGMEVTKFDPAWPPFAKEPEGKFDLVLCTHVLEIIPLSDLDWFVDRVLSFATKVAFFAVRTASDTRPAKARWRLKDIPSDWHADQWVDLLKNRKGPEIHLAVRSRAPGEPTGDFVL